MSEYRGISYYCNEGNRKMSRVRGMRLFISPNFDRSNETMKSFPDPLPIPNELQVQLYALDMFAIRCGYQEVDHDI